MNIWGWWACLGPTRMKFVATNATVTDDQPATEKIQPRNHGNCSRLAGLWTQSCCAASVFEDELIHLYMCLGVDCCAGTTCRRSLTSLTIWNLKKGQICYSSQFMIFPSGNRLIFFIFFHCDSDRAWMCFWCMLPRDKRIDSSNLKRIVAISVWLLRLWMSRSWVCCYFIVLWHMGVIQTFGRHKCWATTFRMQCSTRCLFFAAFHDGMFVATQFNGSIGLLTWNTSVAASFWWRSFILHSHEERSLKWPLYQLTAWNICFLTRWGISKS